jgi:hypothetical protein
MGYLKRNLELANEIDRRELLDVLQPANIKLEASHIDFALNHLSADWFKLDTLDSCSLQTGKSNYAIDLVRWARTLQALYEFRNHSGIKEQIRRLCIRSHERIDTILMLRVAMRYKQRRFDVAFEPNGQGCSDLLVARNSDRFFIEVKRENTGEHKRLNRLHTVGPRISREAENRLRDRLAANDNRIEVKFSSLFSDGQIPKILNEIELKSTTMLLGVENSFECVPGGSMVLLPRKADEYYKGGMHSAFVRVPSDRPIQANAVENMPVRCTFELRVNIAALGKRIKTASLQLERDLKKDLNSRGIIVLETDYGGQRAAEEIEKRFTRRIPERCLGITLISDYSCIVSNGSLTDRDVEMMSFAGTEGDDANPGPGPAQAQLFLLVEAMR